MKKIINTVGSAKFAFLTIIPILLLSLTGSIVSEKSVLKLKDNYIISIFFDPSTNEFVNFAEQIGILDIYKTPVFIILLVFFALSLIICTIRLVPFAKTGYLFLREDMLTDEKNTNLSLNDFIFFFQKAGWKITRSKENNNILRAEQHSAGKYGVIIIHTGLLLIMAGAAAGYLFGFNEPLVLFEKKAVNGVESKEKGFIPFGFNIMLNSFNVEYYEGLPTAKAFLSDISVFENSQEKLRTVLNTNKPLKYKDIVFYQYSYGYMPHENMDIIIDFLYENTHKQEILQYNKPFETGEYRFVVSNFFLDYDYDKNTGKPYNKSYTLNNPAVFIKTYDKNNKFIIGGWLLLKAAKPTYIKELNMALKFKNLDKLMVYSTVLVKRNLGTPVVYTGGILMCFGVLFIYFLNYTAVIFTVKNGKIKYSIFSQRKFSVVNPSNIFYKFLEKEL